MTKHVLAGIAIAALSIGPAFAVEVTKSAEVSAPPAAVWKAVGEFCGIGDWHPAVEKCALSQKDGKTLRTLSLKGGGSILEEQTARDEAKMSYSYSILESPLPVDKDYSSTIAVTSSGSGSKLTWSGKFTAKGADDAKASEVIGGIYEAGLKGIADKAK